VHPQAAGVLRRGTVPLPSPRFTGSDHTVAVGRPAGLHAPDRPDGSRDEPGVPLARSGAAVSGREGAVTATDLIALASLCVHPGERTGQAKARAIRAGNARLPAADAQASRQRGPRTRSVGKPRPGGQGHRVRGASTDDPGEGSGGASCPLSSARHEEKPWQAVAGCGERRTHGGHGGEGTTSSGCASCPYPLGARQAAKRPGWAEGPQGESTKGRTTDGNIPPGLNILHEGAAAVCRGSVGFLLNP
jgi:hypothetical protein